MKRLIEEWLPIAALGEESVRERRSMTALPPTYYLHVWWARRPLVASRAAILASILPHDTDRDRFMRILGIHGDPVSSRRRIDLARRMGERFEGKAYTYKRAFTYNPSKEERAWVEAETGRAGLNDIVALDPTAGGGSIPFEMRRLGLAAYANDLNPVAALILRATVEWPFEHGLALLEEFRTLADEFVRRREKRLADLFPSEPDENAIPTNFLWARTITCPHCDGLIPLSPNWRLAPDGTGVRIHPRTSSNGRRCDFEIVKSAKQQSDGTVAGGKAVCPFSDCGRVIDGDTIKAEARAGRMGDQLFAIIFKRRTITRTNTGRVGEKWIRGYRAPRPEDDVAKFVDARLAEKLPEWEALDLVPIEAVPEDINDTRPIQYGMPRWRDLFNARQLYGSVTGVEVFRELLTEAEASAELTDIKRAAFGYLSLSLDKSIGYNCIKSRWHSKREVMTNVFERHDFSFKWSYAEMATLIVGLDYDWAIEQTAKCIGELIELARPDIDVKKAKRNGGSDDLLGHNRYTPPPITVTARSADDLDYLDDGSIDVVIIDPPYYDNVMYAELSDFFYVWLKRTAGHVYPELFTRPLTDKEGEAVANPAKFKGEKGARDLADRDYRERMAAIFAECRRVLKPAGIMTLMFTHKATGAWDALTTGLMEAGFAVNASWPINTEAEGSLHIKDKASASSTVFLVCHPRQERAAGADEMYWEDLEPRVRQAVRRRIGEFLDAGIRRGVDLYLSAFGPALEEFSRHWPVRRGRPRARPQPRGRQKSLFPDEFDPYAATPEDALDAARREVKSWRLEQLVGNANRRAHLDPLTEWFVLAWDAFEAPVAPYDEALRLARVVGVDMDQDVVNRLVVKKASDIVLLDASTRAAKGLLGPADGSAAMIDALHHAAHAARTRNVQAAYDLLERAGVVGEPAFLAALEAVLEVLPPSRSYAGVDPPDAALPAASDFEALENLRRLAFTDQVGEPEQLRLFQEEMKAAAAD